VTLLRDGRYSTAVYANEVTRRVDSWQYATGEGPCLSAAKENKLYHVANIATDDRFPDFAKMGEEEGIGSVLSIPFAPMGEAIGTLNIYGPKPDSFADGDIEIATLFAEQAAIVIANSVAFASAQMTNEQLRDALDSREIIGQAKGIVMEREKCSADEAFEIIRNVSQRSNRKLRDVALDVVEAVRKGK
jgi:GAF domain-containing protein